MMHLIVYIRQASIDVDILLLFYKQILAPSFLVGFLLIYL